VKIKTNASGKGYGKQGKLPQHENVNANKQGSGKDAPPHGSSSRSPIAQKGGMSGNHGGGSTR
jgi:hypothetical protein